jgi:hypothetical protein
MYMNPILGAQLTIKQETQMKTQIKTQFQTIEVLSVEDFITRTIQNEKPCSLEAIQNETACLLCLFSNVAREVPQTVEHD